MTGLATIRDVAAADIAAIGALLARTWHATYDPILGREAVADIVARWHSPEALSRDLGGPAFLLLERDGLPLATALARQGSDGVVDLHRLYVSPEAQGSGLGTRLLAEIDRRFPKASETRLEVEPRNAAAIAFYAANGFRAVDRTASCGGDSGIPATIMRRRRRQDLVVRRAAAGDGQDLFGLLSLCFAEYPGCFVDPHDDLPDLVAPHTAFAASGGRFFVVEDAIGRICACVAVDSPAAGVAELHRLYVRPDVRGRGLGGRLVGLAEGEARAMGCGRMVLWSDTRFADAHRLYNRLGYVRTGEERDLGDISGSREFAFARDLGASGEKP